MVNISEKTVIQMMTERQFDKLIKLLDTIGLNGDGLAPDTPGTKYLTQITLSTIAAMCNVCKVPVDVQEQLIKRLACCCDIFPLLRLINISVNIVSNDAALPEDIKLFFIRMGREHPKAPNSDMLRRVQNRLSKLTGDEARAVLSFLARGEEMTSLSVMYNANILRLAYYHTDLQAGMLFAFMASCLHEPINPMLKTFEEIFGS